MDTRLKYVTTNEAARMLGYDESHVRRLAIEGELKGIKWSREWMIELDDVMERRKLRLKQKRGRPTSS
jgi:excisionase family DNA binding protein